jgi:predicted flavoprotein YhiN
VVITHRRVDARGDIVVTHDGLEGGPVYELASRMRTTLERGERAHVRIDLWPDATAEDVQARLARRRPKDSASTGLRRAGLSPVAIGLLREAMLNRVPSDADALAELVRAVPLELLATRPIERAISTAGGVDLGAIDPHGMLLARPGTFVAGEMLDWEAPTGGYLLQGAFSTGVAAAEGALAWLARP